MIQIRHSEARAHTRLPWLDSRHSFSFGEHRDPVWNGFRDLLVINEDRVAPGSGFGRHPHRDMEIVSLVLEGALEHRDDLGHGSVLRAGEVQRMTAGSGIHHEEANASQTEPVHFLQIWLRPDRNGLDPSWEQRKREELPENDGFRLLVTGDPTDHAATWHRDARLAEATLLPGTPSASVTWQLAASRHAFIQVISGHVAVRSEQLRSGDGAAISKSGPLRFDALEPSHVLVFDLP